MHVCMPAPEIKRVVVKKLGMITEEDFDFKKFAAKIRRKLF